MANEIPENSTKENYLINDYIEMWLDDGILYANYLENTVITLDVAKKCVEDRVIVTRGKNYPLLVDLQNVTGEQREAREYYSSDEGLKNLSAGAFIVKSMVPAVIANFYLKINKPIVPAKLFKNKSNALKWLEPFKNQQN